MHTEKEAGKKLCFRCITDNEGSFGECCSSDCMAWRWDLEGNKDRMDQGLEDEMQGYCGLAGNPNG
jgi:hypothetical protein